jgi:hypothetical protein
VPASFEALVTVVIALLPGALYVWSLERQTGRWGIGLGDRVLRFIGVSAILHAVFAPVTYWTWWSQRDDLRGGDPSWWTWPAVMFYVVAPLAAGHCVGRASRKGQSWARVFVGPDPAPRAWDYLFQGERDGWIRLKLKSGSWVGGAYATSPTGLKSYSAGYPEPQDLYLVTAVDIDPETGEFLLDDEKNARLGSGGLLIRWDEVEYLQFIDA